MSLGLRRRTPDVRCARASSPRVAELELDPIALAQVIDALAVNGTGVKKDLFTSGIANEAESFIYS